MDVTTVLTSAGLGLVASVAGMRAAVRGLSRRVGKLEKFRDDMPEKYVPRIELQSTLNHIERNTREGNALVQALLFHGSDAKIALKNIDASADQNAAAAPDDWIQNYVATACPNFEGTVPWFYLDTEGFVTVGTGNMVPNVDAALMLPLRDGAGDLASPQAIAADFNRVHIMPAGHVAEFYRCSSSLQLAKADCQALNRKRCLDFVDQLRQEFDGFDLFPTGAKMSLLDMIYNMGRGYPPTPIRKGKGLLGFTHMCGSVRLKNWAAAAAECDRPQVSSSRNAWTKAHFLNAAQVLA